MRLIVVILFVIFIGSSIQAQESVNASGGLASGNGGTLSYSIGQVFYSSYSGVDGTINLGVQQPFEIFIISGMENKYINLELAVYPNPTTDYLTLRINNFDNQNLTYYLFDLQGRLLESASMLSDNALIPMGKYPVSTYILQVRSNTSLIKTFKVVKK